jgi:hypothetical protein
MATSQNGWQAITSGTDPRLAPFPWVTGRVLAGPVFTVLEHVARRFSAEVESIDVPSSWGWAYRTISGSADVSNHASGTAIDLNAPRHPLGASGTFNAAQVAAIRRILASVSPAVRWGGDYSGRKDEMHFEITTDAATVAAVAARLAGGQPPVTDPVQEDDMIYLRITNGTRAGDVWEVGELTADKLSAQQFEDIKTTIVPRMKDATAAAVDRIAQRVAARRTHIWGRDKGAV